MDFPLHSMEDIAVYGYEDLVNLARLCLRQSRQVSSAELASELEELARIYQLRAAKLRSGILPDIGDAEAPPVKGDGRTAQVIQLQRRPRRDEK